MTNSARKMSLLIRPGADLGVPPHAGLKLQSQQNYMTQNLDPRARATSDAPQIAWSFPEKAKRRPACLWAVYGRRSHLYGGRHAYGPCQKAE